MITMSNFLQAKVFNSKYLVNKCVVKRKSSIIKDQALMKLLDVKAIKKP